MDTIFRSANSPLDVPKAGFTFAKLAAQHDLPAHMAGDLVGKGDDRAFKHEEKGL